MGCCSPATGRRWSIGYLLFCGLSVSTSLFLQHSAASASHLPHCSKPVPPNHIFQQYQVTDAAVAFSLQVPVADVDFAAVAATKTPLLAKAARTLLSSEPRFDGLRAQFEAFRSGHPWVEDSALFDVLRRQPVRVCCLKVAVVSWSVTV